MNNLLRTIGIFFGILFLAILNIGLAYILPFPYSKINIIFAVIIISMLWFNSGTIVWISFFSHLFIELFTTTPYGVVLFSSTIAILLTYWFYKNIFTNRSLLSTLAICSLSLIIYRLIYIFLLIVTKIFGLINDIPWKLILVNFFWEFILTHILILIIFFIFSQFTRRFNAVVIESHYFKL